jgi:hypothetical protein
MVEEDSDRSFTDVDYDNVPVNIWLTEENGIWTLIASNYMPRLDRVGQETYKATSSNKEELVEIIKKRIIPLYEIALKKLNAICEGKAEDLYYWKED